MSSVTFRPRNGDPLTVPVTGPTTVMKLALEHLIPGIIGRCGGYASCGTCHVWVEADIAGSVTLPAPVLEAEVLAGVDTEVRETSRLGCQISVSPESPTLSFTVP
ncbi:2Fe-2S iron-sulfur cluster-binding protein [Arthrobacter silvisoli]|uniref:2Fe-2S iron-sulfur cluster-binding protein n=1 Tax=Arthrobacter silvisoli TaxID=2291022 RepID=UPI000E2167B6